MQNHVQNHLPFSDLCVRTNTHRNTAEKDEKFRLFAHFYSALIEIRLNANRRMGGDSTHDFACFSYIIHHFFVR